MVAQSQEGLDFKVGLAGLYCAGKQNESSFSILKAISKSHFWGGGRSDLFTGSFLWMERLRRYADLHSGLQSTLRAQC